MDKLHQLTIQQAHLRLERGECTSTELTEALLARLRHIDDRVQSCVTIAADLALRQARQADKLLATGRHHPLAGIPLLIKDNICTKGIRTTCSSRMLENFEPPYDATVIRKLRRQGAVILGKTNMDEFAMGSSTEYSAFFPTRNPWDTSRVPGGSSGGSAVAIATDGALGALGSDTGGSIRQPAGFCNITGLKPTYGRVSRYGLVAFASSLDQIGPMTKDVTDCAILLNAIAGHDRRDSTSVPHPVPDYTHALKPDLKGLRLGVPQEYTVSGAQKEVTTIVQAAIGKLEELGAQVDWQVSLPHTGYALAAYYILAPSEASANLARYDGVKYGFSYQKTQSMWEAMEKTRQYGFGPEVKRRIMLGTYALSAGYYDAYYLKAQKIRTLIRQEFDHAFQRFDALITPTSPTVPFKIGERVDNPMQMYLSDVCTLPINIAGIPALTVPAGFSAGLPVGMQFLGPPFSEETLLRIGYAYEQATDWHKRRPLL
jgi:aspartyl-tRNA(Asn)/glutamyl-tRNA(Gln) amidotransferase subunit A